MIWSFGKMDDSSLFAVVLKLIEHEGSRVVRDNGVRFSKLRKIFFQLEYCCFFGNGSCWMNERILSVDICDNQLIEAHEIDGMICKQM